MAGLDGTKKGTSTSADTKLSRFDEILGAARPSESPKQPEVEKKPAILEQTPAPPIKKEKGVAKRDDPDYMQCTFRIRKRTSRQLNRLLMDLGDEDVDLDRSELVEELLQTLFHLHSQMGASEALQMVKNLGTQNFDA